MPSHALPPYVKFLLLATAHLFLNGQIKVINGCITVYGARTYTLSADQKG